MVVLLHVNANHANLFLVQSAANMAELPNENIDVECSANVDVIRANNQRRSDQDVLQFHDGIIIAPLRTVGSSTGVE